jgi:hypothetical protein
MFDIVDQRERRDTAGKDSEQGKEIVGIAKRKPRRAKTGGELVEVGAPLFEHDDEPERPLLVLQEKAFAMTAGEVAAHSSRFSDGKHRGMRCGAVCNPERIQPSKQILWCQ